MRTERHNKPNTLLLHFEIRLRTIRVSELYPTASCQAHVIGSIIFSKTIIYRQTHLNHKLIKSITLRPTCLIGINS
jgi:hypothetical protein